MWSQRRVLGGVKQTESDGNQRTERQHSCNQKRRCLSLLRRRLAWRIFHPNSIPCPLVLFFGDGKYVVEKASLTKGNQNENDRKMQYTTERDLGLCV